MPGAESRRRLFVCADGNWRHGIAGVGVQCIHRAGRPEEFWFASTGVDISRVLRHPTGISLSYECDSSVSEALALMMAFRCVLKYKPEEVDGPPVVVIDRTASLVQLLRGHQPRSSECFRAALPYVDNALHYTLFHFPLLRIMHRSEAAGLRVTSASPGSWVPDELASYAIDVCSEASDSERSAWELGILGKASEVGNRLHLWTESIRALRSKVPVLHKWLLYGATGDPWPRSAEWVRCGRPFQAQGSLVRQAVVATSEAEQDALDSLCSSPSLFMVTANAPSP